MYRKILSICILLLMFQFTASYAGVGIPTNQTIFKDLKVKAFIVENYKSPQDLLCGFSFLGTICVVGTRDGMTYLSVNILASDGSGNFETYDIPVGSFLGSLICNFLA
jgi:hypothetical protein